MSVKTSMVRKMLRAAGVKANKLKELANGLCIVIEPNDTKLLFDGRRSHDPKRNRK